MRRAVSVTDRDCDRDCDCDCNCDCEMQTLQSGFTKTQAAPHFSAIRGEYFITQVRQHMADQLDEGRG
eukprot:767358-Pyramimonas_sp.AAC.1